MGRAVEDSHRRLLRARDAMDRDWAQPLDVRALARTAHLSPAHSLRTFKATFGETPHRYLQRRRVERAMHLLRSTELSVTDVCLQVGFSSLGTSSRTFRSVVGESPSAHRRRGPVPAAPTCFTMAWARPSGPVTPGTAVPEERRPRAPGWRRAVITSNDLSSLFVLDQQQALDFHVGVLGLEGRADVQLGPVRWLTVAVPGEPDREVLLELPAPPSSPS